MRGGKGVDGAESEKRREQVHGTRAESSERQTVRRIGETRRNTRDRRPWYDDFTTAAPRGFFHFHQWQEVLRRSANHRVGILDNASRSSTGDAAAGSDYSDSTIGRASRPCGSAHRASSPNEYDQHFFSNSEYNQHTASRCTESLAGALGGSSSFELLEHRCVASCSPRGGHARSLNHNHHYNHHHNHNHHHIHNHHHNHHNHTHNPHNHTHNPHDNHNAPHNPRDKPGFCQWCWSD